MADKRVRTATRATVTRTINSAKDILATIAVDDKDSSVQLQGLANLLRTKLNLLDELDRKIIAVWDDDDEDLFAKEVEDSDKYQQSIYSMLAEIESFHLEATKLKVDEAYSVTESARSSRYDDDPEREYRPLARTKRHIKRPTINMQTFDGNPMEY